MRFYLNQDIDLYARIHIALFVYIDQAEDGMHPEQGESICFMYLLHNEVLHSIIDTISVLYLCMYTAKLSGSSVVMFGNREQRLSFIPGMLDTYVHIYIRCLVTKVYMYTYNYENDM